MGKSAVCNSNIRAGGGVRGHCVDNGIRSGAFNFIFIINMRSRNILFCVASAVCLWPFIFAGCHIHTNYAIGDDLRGRGTWGCKQTTEGRAGGKQEWHPVYFVWPIGERTSLQDADGVVVDACLPHLSGADNSQSQDTTLQQSGGLKSFSVFIYVAAQ